MHSELLIVIRDCFLRVKLKQREVPSRGEINNVCSFISVSSTFLHPLVRVFTHADKSKRKITSPVMEG
jgi:hypothetical protein